MGRRPAAGRTGGFRLRLGVTVLATGCLVAAGELVLIARLAGPPVDVETLLLAGGGLAMVPVTLVGGGRALARWHEQAVAAAGRDDLTGLGSRPALRADLSRAVTRARRSGQPLTLVLFDVNLLAEINESFGRRRGDELLTCLGTALRQACGEAAYRVGGDAFAVLLAGTGQDEAFAVADELRLRVAGAARPLTANVGLCTLDERRWPDPETLLIGADAALHEARRLGGNRVVASGDGDLGLRWLATPEGD